jgi:general secretion pathway protein K
MTLGSQKLRHTRRGSALLVVIWSIMFLSVAVIGVLKYVEFDADEQISRAKSFRARQLAESGLAVALHPDVQYPDPVLNQVFFDGAEGFEVKMRSESAFINLNQILQSGNTGVLERLFTEWGLGARELRDVLDCLLDWTDGDEMRNTNGAEREYYFSLGLTNMPSNRPFVSLEEVELVKGMNLVAELKPNWKEYFTLWSSGNQVDVNTADADVIAVAAGVSVEAARRVVETRWGADGIDGTIDDYRFETVEEAMGLMNVPAGNQELYESVKSGLTTDDAVKRIESIGKVGNYHRVLRVIVNRDDASGNFIKWQET